MIRLLGHLCDEKEVLSVGISRRLLPCDPRDSVRFVDMSEIEGHNELVHPLRPFSYVCLDGVMSLHDPCPSGNFPYETAMTRNVIEPRNEDLFISDYGAPLDHVGTLCDAMNGDEEARPDGELDEDGSGPHSGLFTLFRVCLHRPFCGLRSHVDRVSKPLTVRDRLLLPNS